MRYACVFMRYCVRCKIRHAPKVTHMQITDKTKQNEKKLLKFSRKTKMETGTHRMRRKWKKLVADPRGLRKRPTTACMPASV